MPVPDWPRKSPAIARREVVAPLRDTRAGSGKLAVVLVAVVIGIAASVLSNRFDGGVKAPAGSTFHPIAPRPVFSVPLPPPMPSRRTPTAAPQVPRRVGAEPPARELNAGLVDARNAISIEAAPGLLRGQKAAPVVLGDDEQFAVNLAITDAEFDLPQVGHPFSGRFTVRTFGPSYWAPEHVMPPRFLIAIDRGGELLVSDTNEWGPALASNEQVVVEWKTEGLHGSPLGTLYVPSPGEYRCRIKLFTGGRHSRPLDLWEMRRETE